MTKQLPRSACHIWPDHASSEMLDLCRKYDHDGNGFIEFDEFFEMSKVKHEQTPTTAMHGCCAL
jgi:hypothetical protein